MTTFVLVPGGHTGGWVWQEVAERLAERGHRALPVTLTGMDDRRHLAGPDTGLETHIEDVARQLDAARADGDTVVVGHCYGIHPVLGAVDRRPEGVARVVYLDSGMPTDGDRVLDILPDPEMGERLLRRVEEEGDGWRVPPPAPDDEATWGNVSDVPHEVRERLVRLAAPQPLATLTQPLRLTGKVGTVPATGIFCLRSGTSIALVESLVATGDPQYRVLTEPGVTFFDLDTGHWPMLSAPEAMTEVLLRAAAGEGHRIAAV